MPKTKEQKEQIVAELTEKLQRSKSAVFTQVSGYTMDDANELRKQAKENDLEVMVAKKTLLEIAVKNAGVQGLNPRELEGSVLTTFGFSDEIAPARVMAKFAKDREGLEMLAGVLEGEGVDAAMVKSLSALPSKEELLAKLVGSINAPVSGFVGVLNANLRNVVGVLNAIKESKA
jgi:large subunit ribosomal protein L10